MGDVPASSVHLEMTDRQGLWRRRLWWHVRHLQRHDTRVRRRDLPPLFGRQSVPRWLLPERRDLWRTLPSLRLESHALQ